MVEEYKISTVRNDDIEMTSVMVSMHTCWLVGVRFECICIASIVFYRVCFTCFAYTFYLYLFFFFFQAEDGIRDDLVTDVCSSDLSTDALFLAVELDDRFGVAVRRGECD